jgi:hypothetical protein
MSFFHNWMNLSPQLKGKVVLMRQSVVEFNKLGAAGHDTWDELTTNGVTCQLISSTVVADESN